MLQMPLVSNGRILTLGVRRWLLVVCLRILSLVQNTHFVEGHKNNTKVSIENQSDDILSSIKMYSSSCFSGNNDII